MILLDEPTANLDPSTTEQVEAIIQQMANDGCGVIFTSHHLGQVQALADRIVFLNEGVCLESRNTRDFFEQPQTEQAKKFIARELGWK
jgi:tungstate transport system ATP-binding protein